MIKEKPMNLQRVFETCLQMDRLAVRTYSKFRDACEDKSIKQVWKNMVKEEGAHVKFWNRMLKNAESDMFPEILNDTEGIMRDLEDSYRQCRNLMKKINYKSVKKMVEVALRMEFYLLHPVFVELFTYDSYSTGDNSILINYGEHIDKLLTLLIRTPDKSGNLPFLGKALKRNWEREREASFNSSTDMVTGILNRRTFFHAAKPLIHMAQRNKDSIGVFMIDIDDFKQINDTFGHLAGDEVLSSLGQTLQKFKRASDIAGRFGGEEFIILMPSIKPASLTTMGNRLRKAVSKNCSKFSPVTISIGAASGRLKGNPMSQFMEIIRLADEGLYKAKKSGKDKVVLMSI